MKECNMSGFGGGKPGNGGALDPLPIEVIRK